MRIGMNAHFESYLEEVATRTQQDGGTASMPSSCIFLPIRNVWCFPKYPAKTAILLPSVNLIDELRDFIAKNERSLSEKNCWLGTWVNPQTGDYYLDVATGIKDLETARRLAIQAGKNEGREIVALYNPKKKQTIFLK